MIPARFQYAAVQSVGEAIDRLATLGPDAKILAGGQSLIPLMKLRLASPRYLIDVNRIPDLDFIREEDGLLRLGAMVRQADLETSDLIQRRYPAIADTARVVADPLVRNLGTIGGNLAHGDPANDHPATMLALGAVLVAQGPAGERTVPAAEFFTEAFTTALRHDEMLTEIRVPAPTSSSGSAYLKVERKVGDLATIGVAVSLTLQDGICARAGIGLTNAGLMPLRAVQAEEFLRGKPLDDQTIRHAAQLAMEASDPIADLRGPVEYKRDLVRVITGRALRLALARAQS